MPFSLEKSLTRLEIFLDDAMHIFSGGSLYNFSLATVHYLLWCVSFFSFVRRIPQLFSRDYLLEQGWAQEHLFRFLHLARLFHCEEFHSSFMFDARTVSRSGLNS